MITKIQALEIFDAQGTDGHGRFNKIIISLDNRFVSYGSGGNIQFQKATMITCGHNSSIKYTNHLLNIHPESTLTFSPTSPVPAAASRMKPSLAKYLAAFFATISCAL